ncbi:MAG: succinate dehydrogenase assembly factor 2 [Pseudomonadota bacterium]
MTEELTDREIRLKRFKIQSWRRGTKEMDLLLGPFADGPLRDLDDMALDAFEALLHENDNDLYIWTSAGGEPDRHTEILNQVRAFHRID